MQALELQKCMSQDKATLNSEEIKAVAIAIIKSHLLKASVGRSGGWSVGRSVGPPVNQPANQSVSRKLEKFQLWNGLGMI